MKILIADDNYNVRKSMCQVVEAAGYEVEEARDGGQTLDKLKAEADDIVLVILDWKMPGLDGFEVLTRIKANESYSHIPILMVSSNRAPEEVIRAISAGATDYLVRPYRLTSLTDRIEKILKPAKVKEA